MQRNKARIFKRGKYTGPAIPAVAQWHEILMWCRFIDCR